jgi:hypothetical protein
MPVPARMMAVAPASVAETQAYANWLREPEAGINPREVGRARCLRLMRSPVLRRGILRA